MKKKMSLNLKKLFYKMPKKNDSIDLDYGEEIIRKDY